MFTFYLTIAILLLLISIILCIMFMNEMTVYFLEGKDTFEFFGVKFDAPEDSMDFAVAAGAFALVCLVTVIFWPFAVPILLYYRRFKRIEQSPPSED